MTPAVASGSFGPVLQAFFLERLVAQRNASPQTVAAYRDSFRLLLQFAQDRRKKAPEALELQDLDAPLVLAFLDHLEHTRHNTIRSRNARFAAIRSFAHFAALKEPTRLPGLQRVLAIPMKRFDKPLLGFLSKGEIQAILDAPPADRWSGQRDRIMFATLYNTGARVSELTRLQVADVVLDGSASVRLHGKGRKDRGVPLWRTTTTRLRQWLTRIDQRPDRPLFPSAAGGRLTRPAVTARLRLAVQRAATHCPSLANRRVSPHCVRHYVPCLTMSGHGTPPLLFRGQMPRCADIVDSIPARGRKESTMKHVINEQVVLARAPDGPLATHLGAFADARRAQGYTRNSVHRQVLLAAGFSHWLKRQRVALRYVRAEHPSRYLRDRARRSRPCLGDVAALRHLMDCLRGEGIVAAEKIPARRLTPVERCTQAYAQYLRDARALARPTIVNYVPFIRRFLTDRFGDRPVRLAHRHAGDIVRFVQRQASQLHLKRAKLLTTALRSFLRYARYRGAVALDLAAAVPIVANWSMPAIPRAIGRDQVRQLLASLDRRTAMGRRDFAILLLLARLGLRAGEVACLELDDIDWVAGQMTVRGKRGHRTALPLPADVGTAIAAYLRDGRPRSTSRRVFLRTRAPLCGFVGQCGVGSIVRHALRRAAIQAPTTGAHQFRHALASELLRHGASLSEIGEVLRHRHPQTTMIYAKVDVTALRTLALPWPGGAR